MLHLSQGVPIIPAVSTVEFSAACQACGSMYGCTLRAIDRGLDLGIYLTRQAEAENFIAAFEQQALLRVHSRRLRGSDAKERRVKHLSVVNKVAKTFIECFCLLPSDVGIPPAEAPLI
jgi:hypothetical protein